MFFGREAKKKRGMAIPEGSILLKIPMHSIPPSVFCEERVKSAVFCPLGNYDTSPKNMTPAGKQKQPNSNPIRGAKNERFDVLSDFHNNKLAVYNDDDKFFLKIIIVTPAEKPDVLHNNKQRK